MKKISYLVLLFFITISAMYYINYKEGFKSDYSDYNTIDRIKTGRNNYAYCLAGHVTCPSGNRVDISDTYTGGQTYDYLCDDNTQIECQGNFQYKMNDYERSVWRTPSAREVLFPYSDVYKGFTIPYDYIPVDISDNFMNFYDSSGSIDNINKCSMLNSDIETYKCNIATIGQFAELFKDSITSMIKNLPIGVLSKLIKSDTKDTKTDTKCIADYGTNAGDSLCCGQTGILQKSSTKYVCPSTAPTCSGYTCGDSYGTCS